MGISKELIEKYHAGKCTDDEIARVEAWLLDDDDCQEAPMPLDAARTEALKSEMWSALRQDTIDRDSQLPPKPSLLRFLSQPVKVMAAACLLLAVGLCSWLLLWSPAPVHLASTPVGVSSPADDDISFEFGEGSHATFDEQQELLDFCGVVKLKANKKMMLGFAAGCDKSGKNRREILVDEGVTYFALDLKGKGDEGFLIMREDNLNELPPLVRNSLRAQFGI